MWVLGTGSGFESGCWLEREREWEWESGWVMASVF